MRKVVCILFVMILGSCLNKKSIQPENTNDTLSDLEKEIIQTFSAIDSLLSAEQGKFWDKDLNGPVIVVDPSTRIFYSNENNPANEFKQVGTIFTDSLPQDMNIANTAFDWNGKRWSMIMLPLPSDKTSRSNLIIHEQFHRIQPSLGYVNLPEFSNEHLDTYEGRLLLRLELQAFKKSLNSTDSITRLNHIHNALLFRKKRQKNAEIRNAENSLELNEGLAEYTARMLSGRDENDIKLHVIQSINDFYSNPSFVRSFAYQTIPVYGYHLFSTNPNWHKEVDRNTNLTDYFVKAFKHTFDEALSIEQIAVQNNYGYQQIVKEETEREKKRIERIEKLKTKFTQNQTLELPFQNMNISFDPRNIIPIENLGTVYPILRITDNWGILTVKNGALLASDWSKVTVSEPIEVSDKFVTGDGWQLELNTRWTVKKMDGKYILVNN